MWALIMSGVLSMLQPCCTYRAPRYLKTELDTKTTHELTGDVAAQPQSYPLAQDSGFGCSCAPATPHTFTTSVQPDRTQKSEIP